MSDTYIIEKRGDLVLSWLLGADGRAVSIRADREESGPQTGEIYAGRVQRVRADLKAAFVDIGPGITGYLPFEESEDAVFIRKGGGKGLAQGDELLVQVSSEAQKTKDARLTARLSLQGMYSVVSLADGSAGVSKRLPEEERERLRALAERIRQDARYGLILRTNAAFAPEEAVAEEIRALRERLQKIEAEGIHRTMGSRIYSPGSSWQKRLLSLDLKSTRKIVADGEELYKGARSYLKECGSPLEERVTLYEDPMISCRALYSLDRELRDALAERVWLPGGGYLVIQPTEALTVIDVNSGKAVSRKDKEEAVLKVNLEAAREICRQLRLREISGIVIVDFINQQQEDSKDKLLAALRSGLREDPHPSALIGFTALGLVELTRKKMGPALRETASRLLPGA